MAAIADLGSTERGALIEGFDAPFERVPKDRSEGGRRSDQGRQVTSRREIVPGGHQVESLVADAWQAAFDIARPNPDTSLDDLGVDSSRGWIAPGARAPTRPRPARRRPSDLDDRGLAGQEPRPRHRRSRPDPIVMLRDGDSSVACFVRPRRSRLIFERWRAPRRRHRRDRTRLVEAAGRGSGNLDWLADHLSDASATDHYLSVTRPAAAAWALANEWSRRHRTDPTIVVLDGDRTSEDFDGRSGENASTVWCLDSGVMPGLPTRSRGDSPTSAEMASKRSRTACPA